MSLQLPSHSSERSTVCCGATHTGIRSIKGDLWIWGDNRCGQVTGLSPLPPDSEHSSDEGEPSQKKLQQTESGPEAVSSPINALAPRAAASAPSLKKMSGTILSTMSMGLALGVGSTTGNQSVQRRNSNLKKAKKEDSKKLLQLSPGETIAKIVLGAQHTVILTSRGAIWGWGDNTCGQLGDGFYHRHHHHHHRHSTTDPSAVLHSRHHSHKHIQILSP